MSIFAMSGLMMPDYPTECPWCEVEFEGDDRIHSECLRQRHGGELPEGFAELIKEFDLEPSKNK